MVCRVVIAVFTLAYLVAVFVFLTGVFGWFGQERDPLSGLFLLPLGLPWNLIGLPEARLPALGVLAPLVNLVLLCLICRWFSSRHDENAPTG